MRSRPDKEIEGTVEEIGWRMTRICTFDQRPLYCPNATFVSISVENPSRMRNRRIRGHRHPLRRRRQDADHHRRRRDARAHPDPSGQEAHTDLVNFDSYGASSLDFFIYTFTRPPTGVKFAEHQNGTCCSYDIIRGHGADIAFRPRRLHIASTTVAQVRRGPEMA